MTKKSENQRETVKILPSLKKLALYKSVVFPINRLTVISATIQKCQIESGKKFSYRSSRDTETIEVTRIK